nr:capsid protein [Porcine astrovirus 2]
MANRQQKRGPRTTTNIVVRNGTAATQARASGPAAGNRRRRNRARRQAQVNVRVLPSQNQGRRRFPRRQGVGSRIVFQKINSTLGTVGSNGSDQIECEMTCLMNPSTMKEATGSNSFTPLGIYASTYSLFRMTKCTVTLKPLVGDSAISGTVCRVSWNPTSAPSQTSWSALGARKHADVTPGRMGRFTLSSKDLVGPKGGWYKTNTKGDPMMAFAGTIEIHTLGRTMSTYTNTQFNGGLFLVELESQWQFKDYTQQPGMLNLVKGEDKRDSRVVTGEDGKLQLVVPGTSRMARAASGTSSEIIWLVTDTIIQAGSSFLGPFGWLLRGGWWLVKRAANAPVRWHFQQITPGNVGIGSDLTGARLIQEDQPQGTPTHCVITSALRLKLGANADNTDNTLIPSFSSWYSNLAYQNFNEGVGFTYTDRKIATYNLYKVTVLAGGTPANISHFENTVPIYLFYGSTSVPIGKAVAARYDVADSTPVLRVSSVLVYAEKDQSYNYMKHWRATTVSYPVAHQGNPYSAVVSVPQNTSNKAVRIRLEAGQWYLIQCVTLGVINHEYKVGDVTIASNSAVNIPRGETYFTPTQATVQSALLPSTITGTSLRVFTTSEVREDRAAVAYDLDPSFGCDVAFEFPPPPSDEYPESGEDEFEDPEEDDDEELELGPDDHYSDPPLSRLVVRPEAQLLYENLAAQFPDRVARLAVNQLHPSDEYSSFTELYHDALADGLSPREARAHALGL